MANRLQGGQRPRAAFQLHEVQSDEVRSEKIANRIIKASPLAIWLGHVRANRLQPGCRDIADSLRVGVQGCGHAEVVQHDEATPQTNTACLRLGGTPSTPAPPPRCGGERVPAAPQSRSICATGGSKKAFLPPELRWSRSLQNSKEAHRLGHLLLLPPGDILQYSTGWDRMCQPHEVHVRTSLSTRLCQEPRPGREADLGSNCKSLPCWLCDLQGGAQFSFLRPEKERTVVLGVRVP